MPVYGGIIQGGVDLPRNFDSHQMSTYIPTATMPIFNQLVTFDLNYKETIPETIIGDLAINWEASPDGRTITFDLHQGVTWHDGMPFTAEDVVYSLDKMSDPNRSAIADRFLAYDWSESANDYIVKVHLKYPSVGFMLALAQGESEIQPQHLSTVNSMSDAFMVGTGPFTLEEYKPGVSIKYKRNPAYFKKDEYGNQLPYLDGINLKKMSNDAANNALAIRQLDFVSPSGGTSDANQLRYLQRASSELLFQQRQTNGGFVLFLNTSHPPLNDIRVRRAIGLVLDQNSLIIGYGADPAWGNSGTGLLDPSIGLPGETIDGLVGWGDNVTYQERVDEAKVLLALAGYQNGFRLNMLTAGNNVGTPTGNSGKEAGITVAIMDILRTQLNIDAVVTMNLGPLEFQKLLKDGEYDTYTAFLDVYDPTQLADYFLTDGDNNYAYYSNPELDKMFDELDQIKDLAARREAILGIERMLLIDKPALPTGVFPVAMVPYYPQIKNFRVNNIAYSNINRLEDVWIDESLRAK